MSDPIVLRIGRLAQDVGVEAAWAQWASLTSAAAPVGQRRAWSIVDPEALILASLGLSSVERRLEDFLADWAWRHAFLFSVQRMTTLAKAFPHAAQERLGDFARYAVEGGDARWQRHAAPAAERAAVPRRKPSSHLELNLLEGPSLMLRLRAGFGVNAKADVLTFLLGARAWMSLKVIAVATGYSERAIRTATHAMSLAGLIERTGDYPPLCSVEHHAVAWTELLQIRRFDTAQRPSLGLPPWRFWAIVFAFLAHVAAWSRQALQEDWSSYLASSRARDVYQAHAERLKHASLPPIEARVRGEDYLESLEALLGKVRGWVEENI